MKYKVFCSILIILGLLFLISFQLGITGAVIGVSDISPSISSGFGLIFLIVVLILFIVENDDLDGRVKKLFVKDKKSGKIIFVDSEFILGFELGHPTESESASETLDKLKATFSGFDELKEIIKKKLASKNYFYVAYSQRNICKSLELETEGYYADRFLREWDPNYEEFIPPKNTYLIYEEKKCVTKVSERKTYDTREILPLMEKNIDGFRISEQKIGSHDVHVEYCGAKFQVMAGSIHPYEVPKTNIIRALKRIIKEDIKKKHIKEEEKTKRLEILKYYIFE